MNSEIRTDKAQDLEGNDFLCRQGNHLMKALQISFLMYLDMFDVHQQAIKMGWGGGRIWAKLFYACQTHSRCNLVKYYLCDHTAAGDWGVSSVCFVFN